MLPLLAPLTLPPPFSPCCGVDCDAEANGAPRRATEEEEEKNSASLIASVTSGALYSPVGFAFPTEEAPFLWWPGPVPEDALL